REPDLAIAQRPELDPFARARTQRCRQMLREPVAVEVRDRHLPRDARSERRCIEAIERANAAATRREPVEQRAISHAERRDHADAGDDSAPRSHVTRLPFNLRFNGSWFGGDAN